MEHLRDALEQAKEGDVDGFAVLVERFQDMAVGYSYSILGDFHLAEDAAQEAFLEPYPNLYKVYGPEVFPSWFSHPVYRTADPRSECLEQEARALAGRKGHPEWFSTLEAVKEGMARHSRDGIGPNVDLWSGAIYRLLGIPEEMFSAVFAAGRIPGWVVHAMEQEASAVLLRPRLRYDGPVDLAYTPIDRRG